MTRCSAWLKGRISWYELYNLPIGTFHYLDCMVLNEMKSEEARNRKQKELANDELESQLLR